MVYVDMLESVGIPGQIILLLNGSVSVHKEHDKILCFSLLYLAPQLCVYQHL